MNVRIVRLGLLLVLILAFILLVHSTPARAQGGGGAPRFEPSACPFEVPEGERVECGALIVPERHANPDGPTIRLAVAILKSHSANPAPDPVIYLEGGPGGSPLKSPDLWWSSPFRNQRDLILVDQRGTGYSEPSLYCAEHDELSAETLDDLLTEEESLRLEEEATRACRDRLEAAGVDLAAYNSAESAADFAALREALGYAEINLYGISYGTRLAQTIARDHPEGVRSIILDSTVPLGVNSYEEGPAIADRAFDQLFDGCAADPECSGEFPTLREDFFDLIERTNEQPVRLRIRSPYTGEMVSSPMRGDDLLSIVFTALYDSSVLPYLPAMLDRTARGDFRMLEVYTELYLQSWVESGFSVGMYYSVECWEELPFNEYDAAQEAAEQFPELNDLILNESDFTICPQWIEGAAPPLENQPVVMDIPTLVVAGQYDPITPPEWGRRVAEAQPDAVFLEFPGLGHGVTLNECAGQIAVAFVNDPGGTLPTGCLETMQGPEFATGVIPVRGLYPLIEALLVDFAVSQYVILGGLALIFLMGVTLWPLVRIIYRLMHRAETAPSLWHPLAALLAFGVSGLNLLFLAILVVVVFQLLVAEDAIFLFGLPQSAAPLLLMPWLNALAIVPLALLNIPIWRERTWRWFGRLLYLLIVAAVIGFLVWLALRGLLTLPF